MTELHKAAQDFQTHIAGSKTLWREKLQYRVGLQRVSGAKLTRDARGLGIVGNTYAHDLVVSVDFDESHLKPVVVKLEVTTELAADERADGKHYLIINSLDVTNDAQTEGWGTVIEEQMWEGQHLWIEELPLPF